MVVEIVWDLTHLSQVGLPLVAHCSEDGVLCVVVHVLHEYSLFESMKLPRLLLLFVLLLRPLPLKKDRLGLELYVLSFRPAAPPRQNNTVEMKKQATAAHSKPKAYLPMCAVCPLLRKLFRPLTYAALGSS